MTKKEIVDELRNIAEKVREDNKPLASLLYGVCGAVTIEDELRLAMIVNQYVEVMTPILNSNIKATNAINN